MTGQLTYYLSKLEFETDSWDLHESLKAGKHITIVDARSEEAYHEEHVPGAVNIPHRTMTEETTSHLDKSRLIVTYCDGIGCNASTKAAAKMVKLGFRVKELIGGIDWWKRDGYPVHSKTASDAKRTCGCG